MSREPRDHEHFSDTGTDSDDLILAEENYGAIQVSNDVVASIVRIAAMEIPGVVSVGGSGGFRDEIAGIFKSRESGAGIHVGTNEVGDYEISVKVILRFGVVLAKVGQEIQIAVREQVTKMTNKNVARIDVYIDGVRMPEKEDKGGLDYDSD